MEQNKADIMIGPLSGDESVAIAQYAKAHPTKTFVDGSAGAQDTTLKVRAPNFFRFNGDGAQWNAGLGDLAYNKLGWKTAAVIQDNYSFGWTSAAGFIAEFCAVGGNVVQRVNPPLNTTDYSTYAQQLKTDVDGTFVAVGGAGLIPFLKAYEQAHGPIDAKKFIGNLFWGTPGQFEQLSTRVVGAYVGGAGTAGDLDTPAAKNYANNIIGKWFKTIPPVGAAAPQAASTFTYGFYVNTWGLIKGLQAVKGDISGGQKKLQAALAKVVLPAPYGTIKLDANRQAILTDVLPAAVHEGRQAGGQDGRRDPGRHADVRRHVLVVHPAAQRHRSEVREALASVDRQGADRSRSSRSTARRTLTDTSTHRERRADPSLARGRPALWRTARRARRRSRRLARRAPRHPRAERRREDDAVQRHLRRRRGELGHDRVRRPGHHRLSAAVPHQDGHGADVPEVAAVPRADGRGQPVPRRARREARGTSARSSRAGATRRCASGPASWPPPSGSPARSRRSSARSRTASSVSSRWAWRRRATRS